MLLLRNGLVLDGSGSAPVCGSVLTGNGRIVAVGAVEPPPGCEIRDCTGLAIAPGFIDIHSHADLQVLENLTVKQKQGVTTEVVGNCGFSAFPHGGDVEPLREFGAGILGRDDGWGWETARGYLAAVAERSRLMGVFSLVGHGSLRVAVAGLRQGPLSATELERASGMLDDALEAGCAGFSTGLMYAPGSSSPADELERFCRIVARRGKLYATHMRSYGAGLLPAVREQIALARVTGCRLQISHLQAAGRAFWGLQQQALDEIEAARRDGVDVEFDIYPYQCGSTVLTQLLPQWALDGGTAPMLGRLRDAGTRARIAEEMRQARAPLWGDVTISAVATAANAPVVGRTVDQLAAVRGVDAVETALELLAEERGAVNIVTFNQSEANLRQLLTHPLCSVISDGFYVKGNPHPRLHGTYPELLGSVVRERGWMPLETAVHKITAQPAARLGLTDRGRLAPGLRADVTVFDPARVASLATYDNPQRDPVGIVAVLRA
jgi:N-acyl-D-amino-acid deacylase